MKIYLAAGTYFEKQADAHRFAREHGTTFETVEFSFGASPKSDFVDWLNSEPVKRAETASGMTAAQALEPNPLLEELAWKPAAQPLPQQPDPAHAARSIAFEDEWENLPFPMKAHFASLFCEEAREKLR